MTPHPTPMTSPDPDRLLNTALRLARAGLPVFPCVPDAKPPLTSHGLLDASTHPEQIRTWWQRTPTANLAIATGAASFDVLDVDVHPSGSGYPAFNRLVRARLVDGYSHVVVTPSGGLHAYFPGTDQTNSSLPKQHIDFRATGGYVLAPPSVVNGHPYELVNRTNGPHQPLNWDAVHNFLSAPTAPRPNPVPVTGIEPLASWVSRLPEGQRNTGTFWAACRAVEQGINDLRPLIDAAVTAGLPRREALRTVTSAIRHAASGTNPRAAGASPVAKPTRPTPKH